MFLVMVWHARRRQRAVEDLQASAEREHDFLRDASHTLRTPITVAHGHAELIQAAAGDSSQIAADAEVVLQELRNLSKLSDRILMLAAADHDSYLRFEPTSVSEIITRAGERWRAAAERDWDVVLEPDDSIVEADRDHFEIALDALLENAVKHTIRSDTVRLVAAHDGAHAIIRVEDTGAGIRQEHLPHIFERFYGTGAGELRGTGLGLAIVKSVVEAHGGTVSIASEVGVGTTVTIRLPSRVRGPLAASAGVIPQE
jgi:signal transduction histidine kinase